MQFELSYSFPKSFQSGSQWKVCVCRLLVCNCSSQWFMLWTPVSAFWDTLTFLLMTYFHFFPHFENIRVQSSYSAWCWLWQHPDFFTFQKLETKLTNFHFTSTKFFTVFHSSALCLPLNNTMIDVFYQYLATYLLGWLIFLVKVKSWWLATALYVLLIILIRNLSKQFLPKSGKM